MLDQYQQSYIRYVPMFRRLDAKQLETLAQAFEVRNYAAEEFILYQSRQAPGLIIFLAGMAIWFQASPDGRGRQLGIMQEGDYVHPEALYGDVIAQAYLRAQYPSQVLILTRQAWTNLLAVNPDLKAPFGLEKKPESDKRKLVFETQREGEEVLLKTRRHSWAYIRRLWMPVGVMLLIWFVAASVPNIALWLIPFSFLVFAIIAGYLYVEWANDLVIITSQRIIQITRTILTFQKLQTEVSVESIQEADIKIASFDIFARIFRYGHVELKTAGSEGNFTLDFIKNPDKVQKLILEDIQKHNQFLQSRSQDALKADIERWTGGATGQQNAAQPDSPKNAAREAKLKNIYNEGEGPWSPFVSSFPSDGGGIVYRKHWIVWLSAVLVPMVWLLGTIFGMVILFALGIFQTFGLIAWPMALLMILASGAWFLYSDWDWRHDYYLVTDNSITIVYQRPLWLQNQSEQILLKQVDSVSAEYRGIRQRLFRYGDVRVSLVGADDHKLFDDVANPLAIQSEISARQQRIKQYNVNSQVSQQREVIGEYIAAYHQQQQQNQQSNYVPPAAAQGSPLSPSPSPFGLRPSRPSMSSGRPYQPQQYNPQAAQQPYTPSPQQQGYTPAQGQQPYVPSPQQQGYTPAQGQQPYTPSPQQQGYTPAQGQQPYTPSPQQQGYTPSHGQQFIDPGPQQVNYPQQQGQQPYTPNPQQQGYTPSQGQPPVKYPPPPPARKRPPQNPPSSRFPHNRKKS